VYSLYGSCSHVWHNGANSENSEMRTLPDLARIYLYQSFIKTAINTAITVKLLTSKVTFNIEYLRKAEYDS
jgi:hypothetical protein